MLVSSDEGAGTLLKSVLSILAILFILYVLKPLVDVVLAGAVLAYVLRPMDEAIKRKVHSDTLAAAITTLLLAAPLIFLGLYAAYSIVVDVGEMMTEIGSSSASEVVLRRFLPTKVVAGLTPMLSTIEESVQSISLSLPLALIQLLMMFATMFYYFLSGREAERYACSLIPPHLRSWLETIWVPVGNVLRGMLYGHLITSIFIGVLAGIGYAILGLSHAALLGAVTLVASLLPIVGPYAVFVPVAIVEFMTGSALKAVAVFVYGFVVLTGYANLYLYPKIGGSYAGIHPLLVLVAFIAGPLTMGPVGLIYGPLAMGIGLGLAESVRHGSCHMSDQKEEKDNA